MLIVVSHPTLFENEPAVINKLFAVGLSLFHVRKPELNKDELRNYLSSIDEKYLSCVVLHQHHDVASEFGIRRIHFKETDRNNLTTSAYELMESTGYIYSTSVHSMDAYLNLNSLFSYAFYGPVFDSISKPGYSPTSELQADFEKHSVVQLVGIGGITVDNCESVFERGFDGVAVCGTIWQQENKTEVLNQIFCKMQEKRPYVLTIAGFDPSGGAGLTADTKTFEQHKVYGLAICSGITLQTEDTFLNVRWEKVDDIIEALSVLLKKYPVKVIKTGILPNTDCFTQIVDFIHQHNPTIKIVVDPIFKASAGFDLFDLSSKEQFYKTLNKCHLITPNLDELKWITGESDVEKASNELVKYTALFLKGGHREKDKGVDYLYVDTHREEFLPTKESRYTKHGTGCVLSAAIVSNLAIGHSLSDSCRKAKVYLENVLESNQTLLGYHHV
jgi:hydroxymethylpyrimidine kinase/phosphomethylpyrimidine kinase